MEIFYFTYSISLIAGQILTSSGVPESGILSSADSPYRFILYSALIIAFVYLLVMSQTRRLIKTRRLLKEKEQARQLT